MVGVRLRSSQFGEQGPPIWFERWTWDFCFFSLARDPKKNGTKKNNPWTVQATEKRGLAPPPRGGYTWFWMGKGGFYFHLAAFLLFSASMLSSMVVYKSYIAIKIYNTLFSNLFFFLFRWGLLFYTPYEIYSPPGVYLISDGKRGVLFPILAGEIVFSASMLSSSMVVIHGLT